MVAPDAMKRKILKRSTFFYQFIPPEHLKTKEYLEKKRLDNKAEIDSTSKETQQNLNSNDKNLEVIKQTKLSGVMISDAIKCDKITEYLEKKAYSRMELLRKVAEYTK